MKTALLLPSTVRVKRRVFLYFLLPWTLLQAQTVFVDEFDGPQLGTGWLGAPGWTVQDGRAYNAPDGNLLPLSTAEQYDAPSYVLETSFGPLVPGYYREYYLLFGQTGEDTKDGTGYVLRFDSYFGNVLSLNVNTGNYFFPEKLDDQILDIDPGELYAFRIERYRSGLIQVYVDEGAGFGANPLLEAVDSSAATLGRVSLVATTQTAGEDFFVGYVRAEVPAVEKTRPEKPAADPLIKQVFAESGTDYGVGKLEPGNTFFTDRPYTLTDVPDALRGASFVKTANDDKRGTDADFLTVYLTGPAIAYVGYDPRATVLPAWLAGWTKTDLTIGTTDPGSDYYEVYAKQVPRRFFNAYPNILQAGAALAEPAEGSNMNYIVGFQPVNRSARYEAEAASLSGPAVATNHSGFRGTGFADYGRSIGEYIEWTVDVTAQTSYAIAYRYANASAVNRPLALAIDGRARGVAAAAPTATWSSWRFGRLDTIVLAPGPHTVRLTTTSANGPNVDYLQLEPIDVPNASRNDEPGSNPLVARTLPADEAVRVYPNPVASVLAVEAPTAIQDLRIFDLRGRLVLGERYPDASDTRRVEVDASRWPSGTYWYVVSTPEGTSSGQVQK